MKVHMVFLGKEEKAGIFIFPLRTFTSAGMGLIWTSESELKHISCQIDFLLLGSSLHQVKHESNFLTLNLPLGTTAI